MNITEKLYYKDSHIMQFETEVLFCFPYRESHAAILRETAFFPEGGGQSADTGSIEGLRVTDVQEVSLSKLPENVRDDISAEFSLRENDKVILHMLSGEFEKGTECFCSLDAEQRLRRMQNHSGEHIVSGLVHNEFGFDNVGFHMSVGFMTIDFSGELTWEQISSVEQKANEAIRQNLEISQLFPADEELKNMEYRSKLDLTENVRLVVIPGIDICACCAPHVRHTGEIGLIKILTLEKHRGGVRVTLTCGMDALDDYRLRQQSVTEISGLLSAKRAEVSQAVQRLIAERDGFKAKLSESEKRLVAFLASSCPETEGNICLFEELGSESSRRELINLLVEKCGGMAAVFCGNDESGYNYVIGSRTLDLRKLTREINTAVSGRGGGRSEMIMGSSTGKMEDIKAYFNV